MAERNLRKTRIGRVVSNKMDKTITPLSDGKKPYPLDLIVGFVRPIQLKRLFRDAAGLGVSRILLYGIDTFGNIWMSYISGTPLIP